jgi:RNA polymerase sigma-70 factor (ECF subfamily)
LDFEEIYNRYHQDVFRFCLSLCGSSHIADDLTSEAFLKAIKASGTFRNDCSVKAWLCQLAKNTYYDYHRKHSRETELAEDLLDENDYELKLLDKTEAFRIHKLLHNLKDPYKEVFSLRVFAELSFADIGEIFVKSESWARVTFHRARLKLKENNNDEM